MPFPYMALFSYYHMPTKVMIEITSFFKETKTQGEQELALHRLHRHTYNNAQQINIVFDNTVDQCGPYNVTQIFMQGLVVNDTNYIKMLYNGLRKYLSMF